MPQVQHADGFARSSARPEPGRKTLGLRELSKVSRHAINLNSADFGDRRRPQQQSEHSRDMFFVLRLTQPPLQHLTILAGRGTTSPKCSSPGCEFSLLDADAEA